MTDGPPGGIYARVAERLDEDGDAVDLVEVDDATADDVREGDARDPEVGSGTSSRSGSTPRVPTPARPDVEVKAFRLRWGNDYAMIANPRDSSTTRLEPGESSCCR